MKQTTFRCVRLALTILASANAFATDPIYSELTPVADSYLPLRIREPNLFTAADGNRYSINGGDLHKISPTGERVGEWNLGSYALEGADGAFYGIYSLEEDGYNPGTPYTTQVFRFSNTGERTLYKELKHTGRVFGMARVGADIFYIQGNYGYFGSTKSYLARVPKKGGIVLTELPPELTDCSMKGQIGGEFYINDTKGNLLRMNTQGQYSKIIPLCGPIVILKEANKTYIATASGRVFRVSGRDLIPVTQNQTIQIVSADPWSGSISFDPPYGAIGSDGNIYGFAYQSIPDGISRRVLRLKPDGKLDLIAHLSPDVDWKILGEDGGFIFFNKYDGLSGRDYKYRLAATPLPNNPPIARDDTALVGPTPATIPVLLNDSDLEEGRMLRIVAVSKPRLGTAAASGRNIVYTPGPFFKKGDSFTYTVADQNGERSSATVRVNSWDTVKGTHILELDTTLDDELRFGRVVLTITGPGTYTASAAFGHRFGVSKKSFSGSIDATGELTLNLPAHPGVFPMIFRIGAATEAGIPVERVTSGDFGSPFAGVTHRQKPASSEITGRYTLVSDSSNPSNAAWAVFNVQKSGRISLAGRTSHGLAFTAGAYMDADNVFRYFAGSGDKLDTDLAAFGKVNLREQATSDGDGFITIGSDFANLGITAIPTVASRFTPPAAGKPWFTYPAGSGNVALTGKLDYLYPPATVEATAFLGNLDRATASAPLGSLVFQRAEANGQSSGTFRGKITLPGSTETRTFSGVVFQKTNSAVGFVNRTEQANPVRVEIAPR